MSSSIRFYRICAQSVICGVDDTFTDLPTWEQVNWNCDNTLAAQADAVTCFNQHRPNTIELFAEDARYGAWYAANILSA